MGTKTVLAKVKDMYNVHRDNDFTNLHGKEQFSQSARINSRLSRVATACLMAVNRPEDDDETGPRSPPYPTVKTQWLVANNARVRFTARLRIVALGRW